MFKIWCYNRYCEENELIDWALKIAVDSGKYGVLTDSEIRMILSKMSLPWIVDFIERYEFERR